MQSNTLTEKYCSQDYNDFLVQKNCVSICSHIVRERKRQGRGVKEKVTKEREKKGRECETKNGGNERDNERENETN